MMKKIDKHRGMLVMAIVVSHHIALNAAEHVLVCRQLAT